MHVLIGTDGSDDAIAAARQAMPLLATADVVALVCVVEPPVETSSGLESGFAGGVIPPAEVDAAWDGCAASTRAMPWSARPRAIEDYTSGSVELIVDTGGAGAVICELAVERSADVIVIGSRGRGG